MPHRREVFVNGHFYHVFNKTIDGKRIFQSVENCRRFLETIRYYRSTNAKLGFAAFQQLKGEEQSETEQKISDPRSFCIEIAAYCLMPNHFHLLLKQKGTYGVQRVISNVLNSTTRFSNKRSVRKGPYFLPRFQCVAIRNKEQLAAVSRYIHLNPFKSRIASDIFELRNYPWSSYKNYLFDGENYIVNTSFILELFQNNRDQYRKFVEGI